MTDLIDNTTVGKRLGAVAARVALVSALALTIAGCRPESDGDATRVAGWSLTDPSERHPILVSQQPTTMSLQVGRGSGGLSTPQRAKLVGFINRFTASDAGNSRLVIEAPSGASNEIASMQAVTEIRAIFQDMAVDPALIAVEAYQAGRGHEAPIRVSFLRYVAEGPKCGKWPTNIAEDPANLDYPNLGCATQKNIAAMVANPGDLLGPRTMTPSSGERAGTVWDKYVKGDSTVSAKTEDEKLKVKGAN